MTKKIITVISALLFNAIAGALLGSAAGLDPLLSAIGANAIASIPAILPSGILRAGVFQEIWTGEMVKKLREGLAGSWLDGIPDNSAVVKNDVIHLTEVGVDPDVLVNNTAYPIAIQKLSDKDIAISLDKFQTKATPVTDDELHAMSYDKMSRVIESHRNAIDDSKYAKAARSFCEHSPATVKSSGEKDAETGRLALTKADLLKVKKAMDKQKVPVTGRRLVLCSDHVNDILGWSEAFQRQYSIDNASGKVGRLFGFDVYEYADTPVYDSAGKMKEAGAVAAAGDFAASFAFYSGRAFKATGETMMYYHDAATDPQNQQNLVNFRHYFIAMPKLSDTGVVLLSSYKA
jgi:hypothetical protein